MTYKIEHKKDDIAVFEILENDYHWFVEYCDTEKDAETLIKHLKIKDSQNKQSQETIQALQSENEQLKNITQILATTIIELHIGFNTHEKQVAYKALLHTGWTVDDIREFLSGNIMMPDDFDSKALAQKEESE